MILTSLWRKLVGQLLLFNRHVIVYMPNLHGSCHFKFYIYNTTEIKLNI